MSFDVTKTTGETTKNVFLKILEDIPGGITVKTGEIPSNIKDLGAGTPVAESSSTSGLYNPVKIAKSTSTQTAATSITVKRPILFNVGEFIGKYNGYTASTITKITMTAATTATIVTSKAIGALATATRLIRAAAAASGTSTRISAKDSAEALLGNSIAVRATDMTTLYNVTASAIVRGSVIEENLPFYIDDGAKTALTSRLRFA